MSENEELALEVLSDFLNAVDAGICAARERIKTAKGLTTKQLSSWNPTSIQWVNANGAKGPYEKSTDVNNPQYKAMVSDLQNHGGNLNRDGFYYWAFDKADAVGRKKK